MQLRETKSTMGGGINSCHCLLNTLDLARVQSDPKQLIQISRDQLEWIWVSKGEVYHFTNRRIRNQRRSQISWSLKMRAGMIMFHIKRVWKVNTWTWIRIGRGIDMRIRIIRITKKINLRELLILLSMSMISKVIRMWLTWSMKWMLKRCFKELWERERRRVFRAIGISKSLVMDWIWGTKVKSHRNCLNSRQMRGGCLCLILLGNISSKSQGKIMKLIKRMIFHNAKRMIFHNSKRVIFHNSKRMIIHKSKRMIFHKSKRSLSSNSVQALGWKGE